MGWMQQIINDANSIGNSLVDIREVANEKGAGIAYGDNLNTWADKINNINAGAPEIVESNLVSGVRQPYMLQIHSEGFLTMPTADYLGRQLAEYLNPQAEFSKAISFEYPRVRIPSYFTTINFDNTFASNAALRELIIESQNAILATQKDFNDWGFLEKIEIQSNITNWEIVNFPRSAISLSNNLELNLPNMTGTLGMHRTTYSGNTFKKFNLVAPKLTAIKSSNSNYINFFDYYYGDIILPSLINMDRIGLFQGDSANHKLILRVPKLQTITTNINSIASYEANELYIGRDLTAVVSNLATIVSGGKVKVHIPSGDSTTKTTLDNAGVSYVQDYDTSEYASDLEA